MKNELCGVEHCRCNLSAIFSQDKLCKLMLLVYLQVILEGKGCNYDFTN